jgi:hypothetical protein
MTDSLLDPSTAKDLAGIAFEHQPGTAVYADREPHGPGPVDVGGQALSAEHPVLLVFRDEMPGANWMHPCTYAAVDLVTRSVVARVPSDRPPAFGSLSASWLVADDPDGRADLVRRP